MDTIVSASGLKVTFRATDGDVHAVKGVDLALGVGESVGIVGESGSGKSTVANALVGLIMQTDGIIRIGETEFRPGERRKPSPEIVQMIFQDSYSSLNPTQRAIDTVTEATAHCRGLSRRVAKQTALELLASVGITPDQSRARPRAMSGGQRQRVSIARALAAEPKVLIADEPTSSLDQSIAASLLNLLRRIQRERNLSILFISHDLGVIRYLTQRVYVMKDGLVVESGRTSDVFDNPTQEYTKKLMGSIPGFVANPKLPQDQRPLEPPNKLHDREPKIGTEGSK